MDSPSIESAGSPVSSIDASERRAVNTGKNAKADDCTLENGNPRHCRKLIRLIFFLIPAAMQVDENTPLAASSAEAQRKRKSKAAAKDSDDAADKKDKKSASPKVLQSNKYASADGSSDDEEVVVVTSRQVKRPKLAGERYICSSRDRPNPDTLTFGTHPRRTSIDATAKESASTPARQNTATTSKPTALPSSSAVKDASESHIVHFKNGKLLLKQKRIDFSQQNAALQSESLKGTATNKLLIMMSHAMNRAHRMEWLHRRSR